MNLPATSPEVTIPPQLSGEAGVLTRATVQLTRDLELRIAPVAALSGDSFTHVDLRLYRRIPDQHAGEAFQTAGGFRVPLRQVEEVAGKLLAVARAVQGGAHGK